MKNEVTGCVLGEILLKSILTQGFNCKLFTKEELQKKLVRE
jgi:hypothetical protein